MYYGQYEDSDVMLREDELLPSRQAYNQGQNYRPDEERFNPLLFGYDHGFRLDEDYNGKQLLPNPNDDYFRQSGGFPPEDIGGYPDNFPFNNEASLFNNRDEYFKGADRERERDRNRRHSRDRQRNSRRDNEGNWERSGRRDRGEREWSGDRDRRRDKRSSRDKDRSVRDRSPRDEINMDLVTVITNDLSQASDDSRVDAGSEDEYSGHSSPVRDRGRDRERSKRDHDDGRERHRSHEDRERHGERDGERWMTETPSATILLRGLNNSLTENDVITDLVRIGLPPKDVRFMRRATGASRGFGFVEFQTQSEAQRWMDLNQGLLQLPGINVRVTMHYSAPRVGRDARDAANRNDWMCKCGAHNFKRRDFCYKCNTNRRIAEDPLFGVIELDGSAHVGKTPCNSLLFRDLDALTTEQGILQAIAALTSMPIKNTQVIRDEMNTSRCFAFIELNSVASAKQLCEFLLAQNPPLAIDGKQVLISYAKNTFLTSLDIIQKAQQRVVQNAYYMNYSNLYGQDSQYYNYNQYYSGQSATSTSSTQGNSTNAAAAVAQTAILQAQAAKNMTAAISAAAAGAVEPDTPPATNNGYKVYPPPDVSTYQYDKTSGYYYDPSTGLYYEATTQYYYNPKTSQFMYWDAEKSTYLPAPSQSSDTSTEQAGENAESGEGSSESSKDPKKDKERDKKDKEKNKVAKKIAKDMEKWAKSMNAQKEALREEQRKITNAAGRRESAAADAGFAILQKSKEDMKLMPPPPMINSAPEITTPVLPQVTSPVNKPGLVASYGGDSDDSADEDEGSSGIVDESKLVDWTKLACLLCKRQFQSREILTKHTQFSELHKQNLESLKTKAAGNVEKREYRDRAKERRQKYGTPAPPEPKKQAEIELPVVFEQPTKHGLGVENIGNKLLQKMGWSSGQGLGKANQGRTDPIEATRRAASAGLGARGANLVAEEGATYKECVKKTMFARFHDIE